MNNWQLQLGYFLYHVVTVATQSSARVVENSASDFFISRLGWRRTLRRTWRAP